MPEPDGVIHKLYMERELPPKVAEVARVQGEDPDRTSLLIEELRDMIYEKGDCIPHRIDDDYLIKFLRARFWHVHHAYNLMVRYYAFRDANPEFYESVNPMSLRSLGDDDIISISPYRDQEGRRVICFKFGKWRPSKIPIVDLFRATMLLLEVGSLEPQSQVLGGIGIMDLEGLTLNHAWNLTPAVAQKMLALLATSMPLRTSQIHIVNQGWVFDTAFQIFKPLLTEKMRQRLFFHGTDRASLHKYIDPEALPERYGGTKPEFPYTYWLEHLSRDERVVDELQQLGYVSDPLLEQNTLAAMPEIKAVTKGALPSGKDAVPEDAPAANGPVTLFADQPERTGKINELRKLIQNYDDCNRRCDDLFLCRFLYCCDWNVQEAFVRIGKLIKLKEANPEWFFHKPIATYAELLNRNVKFALDRRDRRGRRVFVTRLGAIDFSSMAVTDLANLDDIWFELMLNELDTLETGVTCLIDMSGYSLKSFRFLTPQNIRIGSAKTDLLPLKNIEFHVVNSSVFMNAAIAILYPMLSKKIKESVRFHYSNWESLHEYIPADILPQEYGGTCGKTFDFKTIHGQVLDRSIEFDKILSYGVRKVATPVPAATAMKTKGAKTKGKHKDADKKKAVVEDAMKLLLVGVLAVCLGQLQAGPVAVPSDGVPATDTRTQFFAEFNNLLNGIAKEALESLTTLEQSTGQQFQSVEDAIQDLEKLYNEKVLKEIESYDGALNELGTKVSPCFVSVPQDIRAIVQAARGKAGQCASQTLARVHGIQKNIEKHIGEGVQRVQEIVAIGKQCLAENSWIGDQINCALQNAPAAVSIVESIVRDAAVIIAQTSREVSALAKDTEQCLAVAVQDAVADFNDMLGQAIFIELIATQTTMSSNDSTPLNSPRKIFGKTATLDNNAMLEYEMNKNLGQLEPDRANAILLQSVHISHRYVKYREKAEKELGETGGELTYTKIRQLRQQLNIYNENHQRALGCRRDDSFLLRFLRAKKFDVEKAFKMMQKYYKMKEEYPEIFKVSPPSEMKFMLEMQIQTMLPKKDEHGRQIYLFRVEKCDPYKIPVDYVFRSNVLALEDAVRSPETQIGGLVVLLDMSGLGFAHARYLSPHLAKKTVEVVQEAFPLRFKAFHVLHEPFYFDAILAVLKPFLKDKIRRRIHLHGHSLSSLHKYVSKDLLPAEYGGNLGPFDNTEWRQTILDNEQYFIDLETYNHLAESGYELGGSNGGDGDAESIDSLQFGDTETEDSEFDEDDRRVLSPKRNARSMQNIEEIFLKNGFDGMAPEVTGANVEKEVEELK
uniref:CRAL-TRIO domain-containing protein n=1 Tax=Anopheles dirus TaxID=7168 RepID=A0A182NES0_9DIPT